MAAGEADRRELTDRADVADDRSRSLEDDADLTRELILDLQAEGIMTEKRTHDMEEALKSSRTIGAAIGIIMENRNLGEDQAFAVLKQASQDSNRKIRDIALELVQAADAARIRKSDAG